VDFRRPVRKADPAMPILLVISGTSAGVFASLRLRKSVGPMTRRAWPVEIKEVRKTYSNDIAS